MLKNTLCKPSLGAPSHVTKILQAKSGQKVDDFEPIYLRNYTDIDEKWFVIFEHTINWLSFEYDNLPHLEYYFSSSFSFFLLFFFLFFILLRLSTFKPLNALMYSKFKGLKISGRTSAQLKLGCQVGGIPLKRSFKLLNF